MPQLKPQEFHEALHSDLGKSYRPPEKRKSNYPKGHPARNNAGSSGPHRAHDLRWVTATIKPRSSLIEVEIRLNFKTDGLSNNDAKQLRSLAKDGIKRFWSKKITIGKHDFKVNVSVKNGKGPKALPIHLRKTSNSEANLPSYNPSIPAITEATATYNKDPRMNKSLEDSYFQRVAAHEVGHSILTNAEGYYFSWRHKGTSNLLQDPKPKRPTWSSAQQLDLMSYYRGSVASINPKKLLNKHNASEKDVKRLIFGAKLEWDD